MVGVQASECDLDLANTIEMAIADDGENDESDSEDYINKIIYPPLLPPALA